MVWRDVALKEIRIFDRWGRVWHTGSGDWNNMWNGQTDNGKAAPEGVYYYYLSYDELGITGNTPRELKGWITLLR
ncbi:MAG: hypothetical protein EAZ89_21935 [Bacteroidetes bacterium]|nr:MAG: hypothetical protein EAZ89_21935 [Bacteroidota bacterium]